MTSAIAEKLDLNRKYRLVTKPEMDGLACGVLLNELGLINDVKFVSAMEVTSGAVEIGPDDIIANAPYVEKAALAFDHHVYGNFDAPPINLIYDPESPSASRVIYKYFGGQQTFKSVSPELLQAVDKADAAKFTTEDILRPRRWELFGFIIDTLYDIYRFKRFKTSNNDFLRELIHIAGHKPIEQILAMPDMEARVDAYREFQFQYEQQIEANSRINGSLLIADLRREPTVWPGNKFIVYAKFPICNTACIIRYTPNKMQTEIFVGRSIMNNTANNLHVGRMITPLGGIGNAYAGTIVVENAAADDLLARLTDAIRQGQKRA